MKTSPSWTFIELSSTSCNEVKAEAQFIGIIYSDLIYLLLPGRTMDLSLRNPYDHTNLCFSLPVPQGICSYRPLFSKNYSPDGIQAGAFYISNFTFGRSIYFKISTCIKLGEDVYLLVISEYSLIYWYVTIFV